MQPYDRVTHKLRKSWDQNIANTAALQQANDPTVASYTVSSQRAIRQLSQPWTHIPFQPEPIKF
jgi:hypothetical protein